MNVRRFVVALIALVLSVGPAIADDHRTIIDAATAKTMHDRGVLFVDVRSRLSFEHGHIPGALNLDVRSEDFVSRFQSSVNSDDDVVIYCRGENCSRSAEAILLVHPLGYDRLFYFKAGLPGWEAAGYPVSK